MSQLRQFVFLRKIDLISLLPEPNENSIQNYSYIIYFILNKIIKEIFSFVPIHKQENSSVE